MKTHKMFSWICSLGVLLLPFQPCVAAGGDVYPTLNAQDEANFEKQLLDLIASSENHITEVMAEIATSGNIISAADKIEVDNARAMVKVKVHLYDNFKGTPSLRSPLVREKLLQLFKQDQISLTDLTQLQALVNQERPKVTD